jgi:hypothetical protein
MNKEIQSFINTVQLNCHIADAQYAGDYTLCVYLLKMREMYRWEQGIDFKTMLTTDDVGDWLTTREGLWDDVEEMDYKPLLIKNKEYEPFDNELINTLLKDHKLVYNAGLGIRCRPHFFVAELEQKIQENDYTILISGKEYARDMAAPAAMAQGNNIFVRRESLRRVIWEILDDARVQGLDNPLTRAMSFYDFENDAEAALNKMTEAEIDYVIQHEIGEVKAGKILGESWNDMTIKLARTQAEIMLRAIRDHLADSITTLPMLIKHQLKNESSASLHFYFGNMTAMRKHLAPSLVEAYEVWHETGDISKLQALSDNLSSHWENIAVEVKSLYITSNKPEPIEDLIKSKKL